MLINVFLHLCLDIDLYYMYKSSSPKKIHIQFTATPTPSCTYDPASRCSISNWLQNISF